MSGVFDRLHKKLELEKHAEGISPLELAGLPPPLRKIMRTMLREVEILSVDLVKLVDEWPEKDRMPRAELDSALQTLTVQGWLIRRGEGERVRYQVNLRRKAPSKVAQGIWATLNEKITPPAEPPTPPDAPPE